MSTLPIKYNCKCIPFHNIAIFKYISNLVLKYLDTSQDNEICGFFSFLDQGLKCRTNNEKQTTKWYVVHMN